MKGIFKFTTAALALVAFASCSNNDLFGEAQQVQQQAKGDILVEVEELEDAVTTRTRAAYTPDGKTGILNWNTNDVIKVTDGTLVKYDAYTFENGAFKFDKTTTGRNAAWIAEPEYASFGHNYSTSDGLVKMEWDNAEKQAKGYYFIDQVLSWDEDSENEGAYYAEIPLWGTAQADDTYGVKVSMKYLTGVLKINMDNVPGNATGLKIEGFKNLSGTSDAPIVGDFVAVLANDDEIDTEAALKVNETGFQDNALYVDLTSAKKAKSVIFVPLIAQKYGLLNISYTNTDFVAASKTVDDPANVWELIKGVENLTVERKKYYNLTHSTFKVSGDTPSSISAVLAEKKGESDIAITTANATTLDDATDDYTIELPACSSNITLELAGVKADATGDILYIKGEEFTGTLTVNVKANDGTTPVHNIFVDMPNANVVITGAGMATIELGKDKATDNVAGGVVAKTLTLGTTTAPATFKAVHANAELGYYNTTGSDLLLVKGSTLKALDFETNYKADVIEINGKVETGIDMTTWKAKNGDNIVADVIVGNGGDIEGNLKTYGDVTMTGGKVLYRIITDGDVTLSGVTDATAGTTAASAGAVEAITNITDATKAVTNKVIVKEEATVTTIYDTKNYHKFDLTVNGKASVTTATVNDLTIDGTCAKVGTATVAGDATITDTDECEAIATSLTMNEGKTLTMNGGYIKALTVNNNETDATKVLTIQHGTTAGYTAIGGITPTGSYKISGTSKWNGKAVGGGQPNTTAGTTEATRLKNIYGDKAKTEIYTATELASIGTGAGTAAATVTLKSNIDLDAQAWTSPVLTATTAFTGANLGTAEAPVYPTINKLNLAAAANTANGDITGVGLFKTAKGAISNLNITNVTSTITEANDKNVKYVGVIAGSTTGDLAINNVKITSANVGATVVDYVGGLVGYSNNDLVLTKVSATALTLNGQFWIGGVVGELGSTKTLTFTTGDGNGSSINVTAINVPTTFNAEPQITVVPAGQTSYGTVGMVIGKAKSTAITDNNNLTVNDLITGNRQKLGFKMCYYDAGPNLVYYYGQRGDDHTKKHTWIGRCSGESGESAKKLTKAAFDAAYSAPTAVILVKHDIYADCDK